MFGLSELSKFSSVHKSFRAAFVLLLEVLTFSSHQHLHVWQVVFRVGNRLCIKVSMQKKKKSRAYLLCFGGIKTFNLLCRGTDQCIEHKHWMSNFLYRFIWGESLQPQHGGWSQDIFYWDLHYLAENCEVVWTNPMGLLQQRYWHSAGIKDPVIVWSSHHCWAIFGPCNKAAAMVNICCHSPWMVPGWHQTTISEPQKQY